MAAPTYLSKREGAETEATTYPLKTPAGTEVGNLILFVISVLTTEAAVTIPGLTVVQNKNGGISNLVAYGYATEAGEKTLTAGWGGTKQFAVGFIATVKGPRAENPLAAAIVYKHEGTSSTTMKWGSVNVPSAESFSMLVGISEQLPITPPVGYTNRVKIHFEVLETAEVGAGETGEKTAAIALGSWDTYHIVIAPPGGGKTVEGKAALTGTGSLSAAGLRSRLSGSIALTGTGTLTASGTVQAQQVPVNSLPLPPPPHLSVTAIAEGGKGRAFDLTDEINGLQWSSVNPGGDEICSFTINRSWFAENPEVAKGNLLRVMGGVDVLWQGRVEEIDRLTGDIEALSVTAYGLGNRLGDVTFQEIYIDRDLGKWGEPSAQRKVDTMLATFAGRPYVYTMEMTTVPPGTLLGGGVVTTLSSCIAETTAHGEIWYFGGGIDIGVFLFDYQVLSPDSSDANFFDTASLASNDRGTGGNDTSTVYQQATKLEQRIEATVAGRKYIDVESTYLANLGNTTYKNQRGFLNPTVLGRHGLAPQGTWPLLGLTVNQIVGHILTKASGVAARRVSSFPYVIPQFVVDAPTTPKDAIPQVNEYADADYGTWGPNSPLDNSITGYFDYTTKEPSVQHWFANREDFEADLNFHTETSSLYDNVDVSYTDEAGASHTERFSITSPDLKEAGLSPRVFPLNAGTTTKVGAQIQAEIYLNLFAGFAPARGSGTLSGSIRHYRRGKLSPYYLRADGSNIRIPDILPAETTFSLDSTPDRRTTFPIKRVTVDASGDSPKATIEFDQTNDSMAKLLAQEAAQAALIG